MLTRCSALAQLIALVGVLSLPLLALLIALMGGAAAMSLSGILLPIGHIIAGSIWAIFHILIVALQAFIFMMLTLVYIGQAHDAH